MGPFWDAWYFHLPNYLMAALIYTLLGRFALAALVPQDWDNYIWKAFCRLSDPIVKPFLFITPRILPFNVVILLTAFWIFLLRGVFYIVLSLYGLVPRLNDLPGGLS